MNSELANRRHDRMIAFAAAVVLLVTAIVVLGCGSSTTTTAAGGQATTTSSGSAYGPASTTTSTAGTGTTATSGGVQVTLQNIQISPASVTVKVGDTVTWTNKDSVTHHLVGNNGEFDSGDMAAGATFTFTFKTAGTIAYHCTIHPSMTGTITVQ